ncbi:MAG TPA: helix-turn-helix transcriptional regulator [Steroidobacteraceae bacterium]|jgi:transcriptional regulator with XRE-family HTH domain
MSLKSLRTAEHARLIALLAAAREKAGLTQQQLADRLGKPQSFVAKYEGGERRLDVVEFLAIARALDLDPARAVKEIAGKYGTSKTSRQN